MGKRGGYSYTSCWNYPVLMTLCDALKARLTDAKTTQIHLADAIVEQAVA